MRAVVLTVGQVREGPQVIASRTHPDSQAPFENEVPEIADGIVEVKAVSARSRRPLEDPVASTDPRVDAVGIKSAWAWKGSRVQSIVRELGGERIDIVPWSADPAVLSLRALSPARVMDVKVNEAEGRMNVIVADDQLSPAIGRG